MDLPHVVPQSGDGQLMVINTPHGGMWRICSGGTCLYAHSGLRLLEQYRALLISQGHPVPPG